MPLSQNLSALHTQMARRGHLLKTAEQLLPSTSSSQSEISRTIPAAPEETGPSRAADPVTQAHSAVDHPPYRTPMQFSPLPPALFHLSSGVHEWFYELDLAPDSPVSLPPALMQPADGRSPGATQSGVTQFHPFVPLMLLAALAEKMSALRPGYIVWIGKSVWPTNALLCATVPHHVDALSLSSSAAPHSRRTVLLDPLSLADRLWAIEQALLCPAVAVVIADGRGLNIAATRRLQLAAEQSVLSAGKSVDSNPECVHGSGGPLALLARPYEEYAWLSLACARWRVTPAPVPPAEVMGLHWLRKGGLSTMRKEKNRTVLAAWTVERCRGKGRPEQTVSALAEPSRWHLEWVCENGHTPGRLYVSADVGNRSALAPPAGRLTA